MLVQFFTIAFLTFFSAMLPGADFAMVTKNTITHSRRAGLFTSLGVGTGILIHITYCALGLAIVISNSLILFDCIKYIGACYLIFLGISSILSKQPEHIVCEKKIKKIEISNFKAYRQGFFCNLFNPKATLFILSLFTVIIKPNTPVVWVIIYAIEMTSITIVWFSSLTLILSHPRVTILLERAEKYIAKLLGIFLIFFGVALAFVRK